MPVTVRILNGDIFEIPANIIDNVHHNYEPIFNFMKRQFPKCSEVKLFNLTQNDEEINILEYMYMPHHIIGPDDELFAVCTSIYPHQFAHKKKKSSPKKKSIGKKKKSSPKKKKKSIRKKQK